jgi:hypothetical protein
MQRNTRGDQRAALALELEETDQVNQEVRERAYALFVDRSESGTAGDEFSDWLAAEAEVLQRHGARRGTA